MNEDQKAVLSFRFRLEHKWPWPSIMDSWLFLVTEVAEVGDALIRMGFGEQDNYFRSNDKVPNIDEELADVQIMLITLANHFNVDLSDAMRVKLSKIQKKAHDEV